MNRRNELENGLAVTLHRILIRRGFFPAGTQKTTPMDRSRHPSVESRFWP
jgi:hypothetical protein